MIEYILEAKNRSGKWYLIDSETSENINDGWFYNDQETALSEALNKNMYDLIPEKIVRIGNTLHVYYL